MNHLSSKFVFGTIVGVGLGTALGFLLFSKTGKKLQHDTAVMMRDFYEYAAEKAEDIKKMSTEQYQEFMKQMARKYIRIKNVSGKSAKYLTEEAQKSWDHLTELWS